MYLKVIMQLISPSVGERMNPRRAGLVGSSGPQNKQPFLVAFLKASGIHLRSVRSASGNKQRGNHRSKNPKPGVAPSQVALKTAEATGDTFYNKMLSCVCSLLSFFSLMHFINLFLPSNIQYTIILPSPVY